MSTTYDVIVIGSGPAGYVAGDSRGAIGVKNAMY